MNAYQVPADPTAVVGRRIAAYIIDLVIILAVAFLATALFADFKSEDVPEGLDNPCDIIEANLDVSTCFEIGDTVYYNEGGSAVATWLLPLAATVVNSVIIAGTAGGSLGKLAMGLRVVNKDTGRIAGIGPNLVRTLLWIVDGIPYCFPLVGLITGLSTKGHRRVGDMAAGTLVVGKASLGQPPVVPGLTAPAMAGAAGYAPPQSWEQPSAPQGWDTGASAPPPPPQWGAPVPPPPADPWAPPAPSSDVPPAPTAPPADPWAAPASPEPASYEPPAPSYEPPASEPTTSYEPPAPSYEPPAPPPEPASYEPPAPPVEPEPVSYEPPAPAVEPEPVSYEPPAPAVEPEPAGWEPPPPAPEPEPAAPAASEPAAAETATTSAAGETPGVGAPMWDAARNAYIQWDPSLNAWMQWDDAAQQWRPIS